MSRLAYDCETNGLIPELTKLHCLVLHDMDTGVREEFADQPGYAPIELGVKKLERAQMRLAHNAIGFDERAIKKVYPWYSPEGFLVDTLVLTRVLWPDIKRQLDFGLQKKGKIPGNLMGRHGLEAWGHRLGKHKGDYAKECKERGIDPWAQWSPEMQEYCVGDVEVLVELAERCIRKMNKEGWRGDWLPLEHEVQKLIVRMEERGVAFDEEAAQRLHADLVKHKLRLEEELQKVFPPITREIPFYPKVNNKARGYVKGQLFIKKRVEVFNPGSRKQIAERLKAKYAWEPTEFTKSGEPALDEDTMAALPFAEAPILCEYLMVAKRLGQVAEGKKAWLRFVRNGRIHPRVNPMGTATSRMSHSDPPIAGTPAVRKPYGKECRACFKAGEGYVQVGCDADALELRCKAGYLARHDGGKYIDTVLNGDKAKGTDMHSQNSRAIGWDPKSKVKVGANELPAREVAKTFYYAMIYGAFPPKLAEILGKSPRFAAGAKARILAGITGMNKIMKSLEKRVKRGFIYGIDGRCIPIRSSHAAFNTLLQSAGAIFMKRAWVIADTLLQLEGLVPGDDFEWILNIHDELQAEVRPQHVERFKHIVQEAIRLAGEHYSFACPLAGNADSGANWAETH